QHVVALGLLALREFEPNVFPYRGADMLELAAAQREIFLEMAAYQAIDKIDEPVGDEEPGKEEVPTPPGGEIAVARQGHRPGKSSDLVVTGLVIGDAEQIGGVDVPAGDGGDAHDLFAMLHRPHGHHRI